MKNTQKFTMGSLRKYRNKHCRLVIKKQKFNQVYKRVMVSKVGREEIECGGFRRFKIGNIVAISEVEEE